MSTPAILGTATIGAALRRAAHDLQSHSDSPALDARLLLTDVLGVSVTRLYTHPDAAIPADQAARFEQYIQRRAAGEPLAYITGSRGFRGLELTVNPAVLIPRPDTETLVVTALEVLPPSHPSIVDLGTGCGAIALALASERPQWRITATDCSQAALVCARANAERLRLHHVRFMQGRWFEPLAGRRFEAIVCNPPYVAAGDAHLRAPELGHEPGQALIAGDDGLADLTHIARRAPRHLHAGGWLLLEHGFDQAAAVRRLLQRAGFHHVATRPDLAGHERVTCGQLG